MSLSTSENYTMTITEFMHGIFVGSEEDDDM